MPQPAHSPSRDRHRIQLRASPAERRALGRAAASAATSMNRFVLDHACAQAYRLLAAQPESAPDGAMEVLDWERFLALLGQPASERERLRALLD